VTGTARVLGLLATPALLGASAWAAPAAGLRDDPAQHAAQVIEKTLQKHAPDVHRCFEKALADRLDVAGNVEVEVDVGKAGKVTAARLSIPGGGEAPVDLAACVEEAARHFVLEGIEPGASVVLPFAFQGQLDQFAVKVADVPERGPRSAATKAGSKASAPAAPAPFAVKLLVDPVNVRTPKAALTLLTVASRSRIALHRHPQSAKALYLLSGHGRFLGPPGTPAVVVDPGTAIFVPRGYPHAIEAPGKFENAVFLQIFTPPGPEQVYRDPSDPEARAAFEVVRDGGRGQGAAAAAPGGAAPVVAKLASTPGVPVWGGKATAHTLLDQAVTGSGDLALLSIDVKPGAEWPRHGHDGASELLYVTAGGGTLEVGSERTPFGPETALYLPAGQPHAIKFAPGATTRLIQIFAPAGPEQQAAAGAAIGAGAQAGKKEESSR
jgi:quercetin dioxygenase-like cupin family protein